MPMTRTLLRAELPALRDLLLRLGPDDRALRFGAAVGDAGIEAHCRRLGQAQRFLSSHAMIYGHFGPRRHLMTAARYRRARTDAFRTWREETCVQVAA